LQGKAAHPILVFRIEIPEIPEIPQRLLPPDTPIEQKPSEAPSLLAPPPPPKPRSMQGLGNKENHSSPPREVKSQPKQEPKPEERVEKQKQNQEEQGKEENHKEQDVKEENHREQPEGKAKEEEGEGEGKGQGENPPAQSRTSLRRSNTTTNQGTRSRFDSGATLQPAASFTLPRNYATGSSRRRDVETVVTPSKLGEGSPFGKRVTFKRSQSGQEVLEGDAKNHLEGEKVREQVSGAAAVRRPRSSTTSMVPLRGSEARDFEERQGASDDGEPRNE